MKLPKVSLCAALIAILAACAPTNNPGKGRKDTKVSNAAAANSKPKSEAASQMIGHGFAVVEGDDSTSVQTLATDVATAITTGDTSSSVTATVDATTTATTTDATTAAPAIETIGDATSTTAPTAGPTIAEETVVPGPKGKDDWKGGQDWPTFIKNSPISRWRVTILDSNQNPVVGATLSIRKLDMGGKKGFLPVDALRKQSKRSNVFTIYIAAGRHYDITVTTTNGTTMKHLAFDSRRAVDVAFPIILDNNSGVDPTQPQDPGKPDLPVELPIPVPPVTPPSKGGDSGVWPWCFDDRPTTSADSAEALAAQITYMKGKMAKLETVVRCRLGSEWDRVISSVDSWAKGKPWHWHHFACDKWPSVGVWAALDENNDKRVKLSFTDLTPVIGIDPQNPKSCDGKLKAAIDPAAPYTHSTAGTGDGTGLYGCNRGMMDTMDIYDQVRRAGLTAAAAAMQAHIQKNEDVTSCTVEGSGLTATAVISFGSDVIRATLANFSPDFLD